MQQHKWPHNHIPFVTRETNRVGKAIPLRCFRDFLWYALAFYQQIPANSHPRDFEATIRGREIPLYLIWTMFHVQPLLRILWTNELDLYINNHQITSHTNLLLALATPRPPTVSAMLQKVQESVSRGTVCALDLSLGYAGLLDHVLFVQGYDETNVYVLDTQQLPNFPYQRVPHSEAFLMKLPITALEERRSLFSRVWEVVPRGNKILTSD